MPERGVLLRRQECNPRGNHHPQPLTAYCLSLSKLLINPVAYDSWVTSLSLSLYICKQDQGLTRVSDNSPLACVRARDLATITATISGALRETLVIAFDIKQSSKLVL